MVSLDQSIVKMAYIIMGIAILQIIASFFEEREEDGSEEEEEEEAETVCSFDDMKEPDFEPQETNSFSRTSTRRFLAMKKQEAPAKAMVFSATEKKVKPKGTVKMVEVEMGSVSDLEMSEMVGPQEAGTPSLLLPFNQKNSRRTIK